MPRREPPGTVATNRRARRDYEILDRFEAGIVLNGSEVKSLRGGRGSLSEAYGRVQGGEVWLEGMHIPPYEQGERRGYDPIRRRKLLLHRNEIERLIGTVLDDYLPDSVVESSFSPTPPGAESPTSISNPRRAR